MNKKRTLTMFDIAKLANVSEATVSRALKGSPLVNENTRKRVQEIAREHNYKVNAAARNFRLKKTQTLAVVMLLEPGSGHEISDPFLMDLLGSIANEASRQGYDLLLSTNPMNIPDLQDYYIGSKRADGLIIIGQGRHENRLAQLAERGSAFVVWGAHLPDTGYCTVGSDNKKGAFDAVSHLIKNGRRQIAFMGDRRHPEIEHRFEGYLSALDQAGLSSNEDLFIPTDFSRADGYKKAHDRLIARNRSFDAIYAASDNIALGAIPSLTDSGIRVPEDVAIAGFDDNPLAAFSSPALTTVRQDTKKGGELLVKCLLAILDGQTVTPVAMPTELIVRQSSAGRA
ncbi:MAG: LacI family DNA-binding transcriptional regulator [Sphingomonadales bacterium]